MLQRRQENLEYWIALMTRRSEFQGQNYRTSHALLDNLFTSENNKYKIWT